LEFGTLIENYGNQSNKDSFCFILCSNFILLFLLVHIISHYLNFLNNVTSYLPYIMFTIRTSPAVITKITIEKV
jgi:hypothetical protein